MSAYFFMNALILFFTQGVFSRGKPGKVIEFHFLFPGLEKSWKLTPGFGKLIKSHGNGILSHNGAVPFFHPAFQYKDTFM